jgi:hypothetical protein
MGFNEASARARSDHDRTIKERWVYNKVKVHRTIDENRVDVSSAGYSES